MQYDNFSNNEFNIRKKYDIIWIDMDGVLCNYVAAINKLFPYKQIPHNKYTSYDVHTLFDTTPDVIHEAIERAGVEFWENFDPYPHAFELITVARKCADKIGILTNSGKHIYAREGKLRWLNKHNILCKDDYIVFAKEKAIVAKANTLLIDDYPKNCEEFKAAGGEVYLLSQPWNSSNTSMEYILAKLDREFRLHRYKLQYS